MYFCAIIAGLAPADIVMTWNDAIAITPLNPVVDGHMMIIPIYHVNDALEDPLVAAYTMQRVAEFVKGQCNIITSVGEHATQSIFHFHVHIVPRHEGDGLLLPWSNQKD